MGTASPARRAAGTKTAWDLLTHPRQLLRMVAGRPATDPALDLEALDRATHPLLVVAFRGEGRGWQNGRLRFDFAAPDPVGWQRSAHAPLEPLTPRIEVVSVGDAHAPVSKGGFPVVVCRTGGHEWWFALPAVDVPLFRAAVSKANAQAVGGDSGS